MLNNIINKNILFLQRHGVKMGSDDNKAVYKYGLQILYYFLIDLVIIFSLAYFFGKIYETVIMTFIFGLFQVFGGGYHAKTPLICLLIMIIGLTAGNVLIVILSDKYIFNIVLVFILIFVILFSSPVSNKKHPISKKIKRRSKLIFKISGIFILVIVFILVHFHKYIEVAIITITLGLYLISMAIAKINNIY